MAPDQFPGTNPPGRHPARWTLPALNRLVRRASDGDDSAGNAVRERSFCAPSSDRILQA